MATSEFDTIWTPRIGPEASAQLRRSSYLGMLLLPAALAAAVAFSFLAGAGNVAGAVVSAAVAVGCFAGFLKTRFTLARALSDWFGQPVRWHELPRMRAANFDVWCQQRGLRPRDRAG